MNSILKSGQCSEVAKTLKARDLDDSLESRSRYYEGLRVSMTEGAVTSLRRSRAWSSTFKQVRDSLILLRALVHIARSMQRDNRRSVIKIGTCQTEFGYKATTNQAELFLTETLQGHSGMDTPMICPEYSSHSFFVTAPIPNSLLNTK